jgi:hypothetical protein
LQAGIAGLIFVFAGLGASRMEWLRAQRATQWSARAEITLPEEWLQIVHGVQSGSMPLDPDAVAEEVLSGPGAGERDVVRRDLRVTVDRPGGRVVRIAVTFCASDADRAVRLLNGLVGAYAAQLRMSLAREVVRHAAEIRTAAQRVQQELRKIRPELEALVDRAVSKTAYFADPSTDTAEDKERAAGSPFEEESSGPATTTAKNPQRTESQAGLVELRRRRAQLLADRTPAHPDVRQIDIRIAEAEKRLAAMPLPIPQESAVAPRKTVVQAPEQLPTLEMPQNSRTSQSLDSSQSAASPQSPVALESSDLFRAIQILQGRVDRVCRDLEQSRALKIPGAESLIRGDDLAIQWADHAEVVAVPARWRDLLLVALAAGLVATAGAGMVWTGVRIDAPLATGLSIERGLAIPVIGTIAVDPAVAEPAETRPVRARWKWPCIVGGLAVIASYFVFLLQPFLAG